MVELAADPLPWQRIPSCFAKRTKQLPSAFHVHQEIRQARASHDPACGETVALSARRDEREHDGGFSAPDRGAPPELEEPQRGEGEGGNRSAPRPLRETLARSEGRVLARECGSDPGGGGRRDRGAVLFPSAIQNPDGLDAADVKWDHRASRVRCERSGDPHRSAPAV